MALAFVKRAASYQAFAPPEGPWKKAPLSATTTDNTFRIACYQLPVQLFATLVDSLNKESSSHYGVLGIGRGFFMSLFGSTQIFGSGSLA